MFAATVLFILLNSAAPPAGALPARGAVVLLSSKGAAGEYLPAVEARVQRELEALGFRVLVADAKARTADERRLEMVSAADSSKALAALRLSLVEREVSIELWVTDPQTGKMRFRTLPATRALGEAGARSVALAAVDTLEATFIDLGIDPAPGAAPSEEAKASEAKVPEPAREEGLDAASAEPTPAGFLSFEAGAVCSFAPGGAGAFLGPGLAGGWTLAQRLEARVELAGAFGLSRIGGETASVDVQLATARLGARYLPWAQERWTPFVGASVGGLVVRAMGNAADPLFSRNQTSGAILATLAAGVQLRLSPSMSLRSLAAVSWASREFALSILKTPMAEMRSPWVELAASLAWRW